MVTIIVFLTLSISDASLNVKENQKQSLPEKCECGKSSFVEKGDDIMRGEPVLDHQKYPWIVSIHSEQENDLPWGHCGGSLITLNFVLTAAHCLLRPNGAINCLTQNLAICYVRPKDIFIGILGGPATEPATKVAVSTIIPHPNFIYNKYTNDIALIKLKKPLKCTNYTTPICLDTRDFVKVKEAVTIAGFGMVERDVFSKVLREGTVINIDSKLCISDFEIDPEKNFCTIGGSQGICVGDSGSAAFIKEGGVYYAIGVTSLSKAGRHCMPVLPVYFTKVKAYMEFIKRHVPEISTTAL